MTTATPAFAIVRPRVLVTRTGESRLLDEIVAEIAEEYGSGLIRLCGGPGSGKSTALAHLAAVFSHDANLIFLDEPTPEQLVAYPSDHVAVATMPSGDGRNLEVALQPWGIDELIEYLLAAHHDACGSVIERLGAAANHLWAPQLACIVLNRFAQDPSLTDPLDALLPHVYELLPTAKQQLAAEEFYAAMLIGGGKQIETAHSKLKRTNVSEDAIALLRHPMVHLPLAAKSLLDKIENGSVDTLKQRWPVALVESVGSGCAGRPKALVQLHKLLATPQAEAKHALAASILFMAEPGWRPEKPRCPWRLTNGIFCGAEWSDVNLFKADISHCDFTDANLAEANLECANAEFALFDDASLAAAVMIRLSANSASFRRANLEGAKLPNAKLKNANFSGANLTGAAMMMADLCEAELSSARLQRGDLSQAKLLRAKLQDTSFTDANLRGADLSGVDLRQVKINGACLEGALLKEVQWEDSHVAGAKLKGADLSRAHLTGSSFPAADLRGANLKGAGLAEIDWEEADLRDADLRGATFHLGPSRSGLVGSNIACEGSKTGFYTDDLEDMTFKRPEEIRKANLCSADLRGVKADNVDFYLVDLRQAKLDPELREQARSTGAILENHHA